MSFDTNLTPSPTTPRPVRVPLEGGGHIHVAQETVDGASVAAMVAASATNVPTPLGED